MKKRIFAVVLSLFMLIPTVYAGDVSVLINNKKIEFDVPPMIINDRTMVPVRKIFEEMGAVVEWLGESKLIFASRGSKIIAMTIGDYSFKITDVLSNETKVVELDSPPVIVNSRTLVPVRAIMESLDMNVEWVASNRSVLITNKS